MKARGSTRYHLHPERIQHRSRHSHWFVGSHLPIGNGFSLRGNAQPKRPVEPVAGERREHLPTPSITLRERISTSSLKAFTDCLATKKPR